MTNSVTSSEDIRNIRAMREQRWLRIIPVALIMYTISYVDRTNISLTLEPTISTMMKDLLMDDELKGQAAGIFFIGYVLLQLPGGYLASRWSARKVISIFLIDRKSTRLNSSHSSISYAVFCLKKKINK